MEDQKKRVYDALDKLKIKYEVVEAAHSGESWKTTTAATCTKEGYTFKGWSLLPNGYKQVEYIESTGTQYINTAVLGSKNIGFDLEFKINEYGSEKGIFATSSASSGPPRSAERCRWDPECRWTCRR